MPGGSRRSSTSRVVAMSISYGAHLSRFHAASRFSISERCDATLVSPPNLIRRGADCRHSGESEAEPDMTTLIHPRSLLLVEVELGEATLMVGRQRARRARGARPPSRPERTSGSW